MEGKIRRQRTIGHLEFRKLIHFFLIIAQLLDCCLLLAISCLVYNAWCLVLR